VRFEHKISIYVFFVILSTLVTAINYTEILLMKKMFSCFTIERFLRL